MPAQWCGVPPPTPVAPTAFPTWRQAMPSVYTVYSIANTGSMNGLTGNTGTINSWNGFAASNNAWYSALNGGHADSSENKVMKFPFLANVPAWALLNAGSASPGAADASYYPDGLPASRHSYYTAQYIASRNRVMLFTSAALWGTGGGQDGKVNGFELGSNTWDAAGTFTDAPFFSTASAVARDPRNDNIYLGSTISRFAKWTAATATWSTISPISGSGSWEFKGAMVDGSRDRLVQLNGNLHFIDLTTLVHTSLTVTGPLAGLSTIYWSIVHDTDNDHYIVVDGTNIYAIHPTTGVSWALATVTTPTNGVNNRLAYIQEVGGIAYLPNFTSNVQFMPTRIQ